MSTTAEHVLQASKCAEWMRSLGLPPEYGERFYDRYLTSPHIHAALTMIRLGLETGEREPIQVLCDVLLALDDERERLLKLAIEMKRDETPVILVPLPR